MSQQSDNGQQGNSRKRKRIPVTYADTTPQSEEQPSNSQESSWWEIKEIIGERGRKYLVVWAGIDPETVQPWKPEWKGKDEVSWAAIREWEAKKKAKRAEGKRAGFGPGSTASPVRKRRRRPSTIEAGSQSPEYKPSGKPSRPPIEPKVPRTRTRTRSRDIPSSGFNPLTSETPRAAGIGDASSLRDNVHTPPSNKGNSPGGTQPPFRASAIEPPRKPPRFKRTAVIPDSQGSLSSLDQTASQSSLPSRAPSQERGPPELPLAPRSIEDWIGGGLLVSGPRQHRSADSQAPPTAESRERFPRLSLPSSADPPALDNHLQKQPESSAVQTQQPAADHCPVPYSPAREEISERVLSSIDSCSQLPSAQVQPVNYYSGNFESELCFQELNFDEKPAPDINPPVAQPNLYQNRCGVGTSFRSCVPRAPSPSATRTQPTGSVEDRFGRRAPLGDERCAEQLSLISRDLLADCRKSHPPTPDLSTEVSQLQSAEFLGHSAQERGTVAATDTSALLESWFGSTRTLEFQSEPEPPSSREQANTFRLHGSLRLHADDAHGLSRSAMSDHSPTIRTATAPISGGGSQTLRERLARSRKALDDRIIAGRNARNSLTPVSTPIKLEPRSSPRTPSLAPATRSEPPAASTPVPGLPEEGSAPQCSPEIPGQAPSSEVRQSHLNFSPSQFGPLQLGPAEYVVGLPLNTEPPTPGGMNQKATYVRVLAAEHTEIEKFTGHSYPAPETLVQAMEKVLDQCRLIATHPDLPYKSVGIASDVVEKEAAYHISMSSKFAFLEKFLNSARKHFLRIFIVAEAGKLIDILEIFLRGIKIACTRLDRLSILPRVSEDDIDGLVKVSLVPSCKSGIVTGTSDCLIAMDSSFNVNLPEIVKIRSNLVEVGKLSPVIRLVALNTIEHVQLYCPHTGGKQLYTYIEVIKNLRVGAGVAVESYKSTIADAPTKIVTWLSKKAQGPLDLTTIPPLPLPGQASQSSPSPDLHDKRKREDESIESQVPGSTPPGTHIETKRLRISDPGPSVPLPDPSQAPSNITSISNPGPSQPPPSPPAEQATKPGASPTNTTQGDSDGGGEDKNKEAEVDCGHPNFPITDCSIPNNQEVAQKSREALITSLKQARGTLREWVEFSGRLQTKVEEIGKTLTIAHTESEKAKRAQKLAEDRKERVTNELSKVKAEAARLTADLREARNALMAGPYAIAAAEKLRVESEKLSEKLRAAEKRAVAKDEDFEFLRNQYQEASAVAVETRKEAEELRKTNEYLERRAADNVTKLRQMHVDNQVSARDQEIENLKAQLKQRDDRLSRMERENERRTTHANSRGATPTSAVPYRKSPIESPSGSLTVGTDTPVTPKSATSGLQVTRDAPSQLEPVR